MILGRLLMLFALATGTMVVSMPFLSRLRGKESWLDNKHESQIACANWIKLCLTQYNILEV